MSTGPQEIKGDGLTADLRPERQGARMRYVLEGYAYSTARGIELREHPTGDPRTSWTQVLDPDTPLVQAAEVLPDPEPAWWPPQPGDVVSAEGRFCWVRGSTDDWARPENGAMIEDRDLLDSIRRNPGDFQLLVRGGKPYHPPLPPALKVRLEDDEPLQCTVSVPIGDLDDLLYATSYGRSLPTGQYDRLMRLLTTAKGMTAR